MLNFHLRYDVNSNAYVALASGTQILEGVVNSLAVTSSGVIYAGGVMVINAFAHYLSMINSKFQNSKFPMFSIFYLFIFFKATFNGTGIWFPIASRFDSQDYAGQIYTLLLNSTNGDVYFGGGLRRFATFGQPSDEFCMSGTARYTPTNANLAPLPSPSTPVNWTEFGGPGGIEGSVYGMASDYSRGRAFIGGPFYRVKHKYR